MKEIILSINDEAEVAVINDKLSEKNVSKYISNTDVVIDAIDCVVDKVALIIYCHVNHMKHRLIPRAYLFEPPYEVTLI